MPCERYKHLVLHEASNGLGLHDATVALVRKLPLVEALYSVGGANAAIKEAFTQLQRPCRAFLAHDLDADNLRLVRNGALHAVLSLDMRKACAHLMVAHRAAPNNPLGGLLLVQVITPYNLPREVL